MKWTHKTTEKIANQLQLAGIQVGRSTVARLLDDLGFALRVNQKKRAGASSPDRNEKFLFIQDMRQRFELRGNPVISVDTKKSELIGNFKNAGAKWSSSAEEVNDHDFLSLASGKGIPYGAPVLLFDSFPPRRSPCLSVSAVSLVLTRTVARQSD